GANCFCKFSLLQFFFDRQAELGEGLDIGTRMKFQILELGENSQRLFQITGLLLPFPGFLVRRRWRGFNRLILDRTARFFFFPRLALCLMMMFLLRNLLGVSNVSGIRHSYQYTSCFPSARTNLTTKSSPSSCLLR